MFANGARFPAGTAGGGKTLTEAVLNGTDAIPVNGNYPPIPAVTGAQWLAALDNAVFHIFTSMNRANLLEGTPYGSQSGGCTAAAANCTPFVPPRPDLQALMAPDFEIAKDVAEKSATLLKNTDGALPLETLGLRRRGTAGDGSDRDRDVRRRRRQRARHPVRADHELPDGAARRRPGHAPSNYVQGYDLDGRPVVRRRPRRRVPTGENGWLRQQVSTTLPGLRFRARAPCAGTCAADRLDPTVDYTERHEHAPGRDGLALDDALHRARGTGRSNSWQLKVFVKNQSSGAAVRRRAGDGSTPDQHRRLRRCGGRHRRLFDPRLGWPRAGERSPTTASSSSRPPSRRPSRRARRTSSTCVPTPTATDPLSVQFKWVPPDWQAQSIAAAPRPRSSAKKVVIFAFDDGTEGVDRGGNDQNLGLQLPAGRTR